MQTKLHLVTGFLGSGKTTAIFNACQSLVSEGKRVAVITNGPGKHLVDTTFFTSKAIPTVEVGGGCYCRSFANLEEQIKLLIETVQPDAIFAEASGSCADLVATVVKPLVLLTDSPLRPRSFSMFVDSRLLSARLSKTPLPFSDEIVYIFDKQIEETNLLVCNKMDCLPVPSQKELLILARKRWPNKVVLPQTSLSIEGVEGWLELIESGTVALPMKSIDIDYDIYAQGEQKMAWMDAEIEIETGEGHLRDAVMTLLNAIQEKLEDLKAPVGHIKYLLQASGESEIAVSFSTLHLEGWQEDIPAFQASRLRLMLNMGVEIPPQMLKDAVQQVLNDLDQAGVLTFRITRLELFHPTRTEPEYRY